MKRYYLRFRFMLMTFALGLASVFAFDGSLKFSDEVYVELPEVQSESVFNIITKRNWNGFEPVGVGCGGRNIYGGQGSVVAYQNNSFRNASVSASSYGKAKDAAREIEQRIKDADKVLELTEKSKHKRVVLESKRNGKIWVDILEYTGGKRIDIITASTLELALEFEKWNNSQNK